MQTDFVECILYVPYELIIIFMYLYFDLHFSSIHVSVYQ